MRAAGSKQYANELRSTFMRKLIIAGVVVAVAGAVAYFGFLRREQPAAAAGQAQAGGQQGPGGMGGFGGPGGGFRPPMTVEIARVSRGEITMEITVVGNLIGQQTVDVAPKAGGRLQSISVKLGDRVRKGQMIAKIEDRELMEQVNQAEASHQVAEAGVRRSEADLSLAQTNVERARNLYGRQLLPKQQLDDAEARYVSAVAQLDLSKAQVAQSEARLKELRINLANTSVVSPTDGFVSQRHVDPGAWVSQNAPVASVVDIATLRLVANVVEKDLKAVNAGDPAVVEVDAYPGENFNGRIARVSPILDTATRTAAMEIEIPNRDNRLKPGMYAKVTLEIDRRENVLLIPKTALVDVGGERGIFQPNDESRAQFKAVKIGLEQSDKAEVTEGLQEGEVVISTGAGALRRNDQLIVANGGDGPSNRRPGAGAPPGSRRGGPGGQGRPRGQDGQGQPPNRGTSPSGQEPGEGRPDAAARGQQRPIA